MRNAFKRLLLRLVFGSSYDYFKRSLCHVNMRGSHYVDILVRKGGQDSRVEADWLKNLQRLFIAPPKRPRAMPPLPTATEESAAVARSLEPRT